MSLEQANRYYYLAAQARQKGRTAIADALERQAEREKEKSAMDVNDVAAATRDNAANAQSTVAAPTVQAPVEQAPVEQAPVAADTGVAPAPQNPSQPAPPPTYQPSAEESANQADAEQYATNNNVNSIYGQNYNDLGVNTAYTPVLQYGGSAQQPSADANVVAQQSVSPENIYQPSVTSISDDDANTFGTGMTASELAELVNLVNAGNESEGGSFESDEEKKKRVQNSASSPLGRMTGLIL